jgi:hypothetical protein
LCVELKVKEDNFAQVPVFKLEFKVSPFKVESLLFRVFIFLHLFGMLEMTTVSAFYLSATFLYLNLYQNDKNVHFIATFSAMNRLYNFVGSGENHSILLKR